MSDTVAELEHVLAIAYSNDFLTALAELDPERSRRAFEEREPLLGAFWALASLHDALGRGGASEYLRRGEADHFDLSLASCRLVGAAAAVRYLQAIAALFPDSHVPRSEEERTKLVEQIRRHKPAHSHTDAFGDVDARHSAALDELVTEVRRFVRNHEADIVTAVTRAEAAVGSMEVAGQGSRARSVADASARELTSRIHRSAPSSVPSTADLLPRALPPLWDTADPRVTQLCEDLLTLDVEAWIVIAKRYDSTSRAMNDAMSYTESIPYAKLYPKGEFERRVHAAVAEIRKPLLERLRALPDEVPDGETTFPLRRVAREAALRAVFALSRAEWLRRDDAGRIALRTLMGPFAECVVLPEMD